ncbi:MAG: tetratricopeptide repeat protein [Endomicrobia bacterium]|nr:tetratricopeptide repeat protein [Endomicrobiia bacterium]
MFKKKADMNLRFSIVFTVCFLLACAGVYIYVNSGYSKDVILQKANGYYFNEQYFMAAKYYAKAIELRAENADLYRNYGISLTKLSNYDSAVKYLKLSAEIAPSNPEIFYSLGNALYMKAQTSNNSEKFLQAAEYFEKAAELDPEMEKAYLLIGLSYRSVGMQENARAWYRRALLFGNFSSAGFQNLIGHTFKEEERYKEAANHYKKAIDSDLGFVAAYCNLGDMYLKMNDTQAALDYYEKAADINPEYIVPYLKTGAVYAEQNNYDEAIPLYLRAIQINPDNDKANYLLAMAYKNIGRNAEAVKYLKKAAYRGSDEAIYELRNIGIDLR